MNINCEYLNTTQLLIPPRLGMAYSNLDVFNLIDSNDDSLFTVAIDIDHAEIIGLSNGLVNDISVKPLGMKAFEYHCGGLKYKPTLE